MNRWRVLVVDDVELVASQTADILGSKPVSSRGETADVEPITSFDTALELLEQRHYDLLILDVRNESGSDISLDVAEDTGSEETAADIGLQVFREVRRRRFVPIIFYTAVPNLVIDLAAPPFVAVVSKRGGPEELQQSVQAVFDSTLPAIHRALLDHVDQIVREFMSEFVEMQWSQLSSPRRKGDLAHLLLRRLALSLAGGGEVLSGRLADEPGVELLPDSVHPMRYYVVPPLGSWRSGDVITGPKASAANAQSRESDASGVAIDTVPVAPIDDSHQPTVCWYVVLTPACDLVPTRVKADYVVLAECTLLDETPEFRRWKQALGEGVEPSSNAKKAEDRLRNLMSNRPDSGRPQDRHLYLPGAWEVPDLIVDFQRILHVPYGELSSYQRVATLDSPYAEALVEKFGRYLGRLGTPDLDLTVPLERLRQP